MCGYFAYLNKNLNIKKNRKKLNISANLLSHRGPDKSSTFETKNLFCKFFRLKIIDLTDNAMQPMTDLSKRYLLLFNGEIYNFKEINKKYLSDKKFNINSDTSTLFNMLIKYKEKALDYIDGMFSFVFFDFIQKKIIFARDRFGIKPLYYHFNKNQIIFSSEIKPILSILDTKSLNKESLIDFFLKGSMDHDHKTFFSNVNSLEPGKLGTYNLNKKKLVIKKYWDISNAFYKKSNETNSVNTLKKLFDNAIDSHLISDRKLGLFLSGGTDSTALAHLISKKLENNFSTYTYGFKNDTEFSEINKANVTVNKLKIRNYSYEINSKYIINNFYKLTNNLESPFTSIRLFGIDALYKYLKNKSTKVILEGDGGDELFGGYDYNFLPYLTDKYKNKRYLNFFNDLIEFTKMKKKKRSERLNHMLSLCQTNTYQFGSTSDGTPYINIDNFDKDFLNDNLDEVFFYDYDKKIPKLDNNLKKSQYIDMFYLKLPRALKYKDRISMSYGIESRIPYLDHHFASYCFGLDNNFKIKNFETRYLFKKFLKKITKSNISLKKTKFSIADPQTEWLKKDLKNFTLDHFKSGIFKNLDFFNSKEIIKNFENFCYEKKSNSSFQFFQILSFIIFYNNFFKNKSNVN